MSVGAGSIKRAATKAGNTAKAAGASKAGRTAKAAATTKAASASKKEASVARAESGTTKKAASVKSTDVKASMIAAVSPEVVEKMQLGKQQFCHLTEELPVHLL